MKARTVHTRRIVGILALLFVAVLAMVMFLFGQSGHDSAGAAGDVGMSLKITSPDKSTEITSITVGGKFAIQVVTDPAPDVTDPADVGGYSFWRGHPSGWRDQIQRAG